MEEVVITGMGCVSALGNSPDSSGGAQNDLGTVTECRPKQLSAIIQTRKNAVEPRFKTALFRDWKLRKQHTKL